MVRYTILHEVTAEPDEEGDGWHEVRNFDPKRWYLYLQWGIYIPDGGDNPYYGYRFIWRRPDGTLQPARAQARLPSLAHGRALMELADKQGWGDFDAYSEEYTRAKHVVVA